jgi:hypothetical protein
MASRSSTVLRTFDACRQKDTSVSRHLKLVEESIHRLLTAIMAMMNGEDNQQWWLV